MSDANEWQENVREFHWAFCPEQVRVTPAIPDDRIVQLRLDLINEELYELAEAFDDGDLVEVADALFDLLYVTIGTAEACGIELGSVWEHGHASNMTKVGGERRADGKMLRGPDYRPPDFTKVLREQGWPGRDKEEIQ